MEKIFYKMTKSVNTVKGLSEKCSQSEVRMQSQKLIWPDSAKRLCRFVKVVSTLCLLLWSRDLSTFPSFLPLIPDPANQRRRR